MARCALPSDASYPSPKAAGKANLPSGHASPLSAELFYSSITLFLPFFGPAGGAKPSPPRHQPRRAVSSPGEAGGARGGLRGRRAGRSRGAAVREVSSGAQEIPPAPRPVFALRAEKGAERLQRPSRACRTPRGRAMSDQVRPPPARPGEPQAEGKERRRGAARPRAREAAEELPGRPLRAAGPRGLQGERPALCPRSVPRMGPGQPRQRGRDAEQPLPFAFRFPAVRQGAAPWSWPGLPAAPFAWGAEREGEEPKPSLLGIARIKPHRDPALSSRTSQCCCRLRLPRQGREELLVQQAPASLGAVHAQPFAVSVALGYVTCWWKVKTAFQF